MALFNHLFPYTNLHDINLDWIISIIKSIDPAVIQALQQLTPDIIEQVTQKVNEAQAAAIAAQSSASEANTAKENAATSAAEAAQDATEAAADAALANADAVRAENAKTTIENSLTPVPLTATFADFINLTSQNMWRSGAVTYLVAFGAFATAPETPDYPTIVTFPAGVGQTYQTMPIIIGTGATTDLTILGITDGHGDLNKGNIKSGETFLLFGLLK